MKPKIATWLRSAILEIAKANNKELQQVEDEIAALLCVSKATVQSWKTDFRNPTPEHLFQLIHVVNELHPEPSQKPIVELLISWGVPLSLDYKIDPQSIGLAQQIEVLATDERQFVERYLRLEPNERAALTHGFADLLQAFFGRE